MTLLLPFLDKSSRYCRGVELGMQLVAKMLAGYDVISGYWQVKNEEQIRLAAYRMGYSLHDLKTWKWEGKPTGWVYIRLVRNANLVDGAGI